MVRMMQDEIKHDPVMWKRYVEAMNAAIDLEIELMRKENDIQITSTALVRDAT